eukprot:TRINITY_DN1206_c0_g1_i1.p1 TRINITY_DN1206_c0_g1~~TRINITY_DN1206_c0_g1_i1.p1  ORF type:complete len:1031 (-),score=245.91 TRINITY_DN1206_c0_g1_i1:45-3137(-)
MGDKPNAQTSEEKEKLEKQKINIQTEFLNTEDKYLKALKIIEEVYHKKLDESKLLSKADTTTIFSNTAQLLLIHTSLYEKLKSSASDSDNFGTAIGGLIPFLKIYTEYVNSYDAANSLLQSKRGSSNKLNTLLDELHDLPECNRLQLEDYLIMPIQRLPRYELLLRDILRCTVDEGQRSNIEGLLKHVSQVNTHVNQSKGDQLKREKLKKLQTCVKQKIDLFSRPARKFIKDAELDVLYKPPDTFKTYHFFLFDDFLLQTKTEKDKWAFISAFKLKRVKLGDDNDSTQLDVHVEGEGSGLTISSPQMDTEMDEIINPTGDEVTQSTQDLNLLSDATAKKIVIKCKTTAEKHEWREAITNAVAEYHELVKSGKIDPMDPLTQADRKKLANSLGANSGSNAAEQSKKGKQDKWGDKKQEKDLYTYDYLFKLCVMGDGVGKDIFLDNLTEVKVATMRLKTVEVNNKTCKLQLWDTPSYPESTISEQAIKGAQIVLFVYDLMKIESWKNLEKGIRHSFKPDQGLHGILLGHRYLMKDDLADRKVKLDDVLTIAHEYGFDVADIGISEDEVAKFNAKLSRIVERVVESDKRKKPAQATGSGIQSSPTSAHHPPASPAPSVSLVMPEDESDEHKKKEKKQKKGSSKRESLLSKVTPKKKQGNNTLRRETKDDKQIKEEIRETVQADKKEEEAKALKSQNITQIKKKNSTSEGSGSVLEPSDSSEKLDTKLDRSDSKLDKSDKSEKSERREKSDKKEKSERKPKREKSDKSEKGDKSEKSDRSDKGDKSEKSDKAEKVDKPEKADKSDKAEKVDKPEKADKLDKSDKSPEPVSEKTDKKKLHKKNLSGAFPRPNDSQTTPLSDRTTNPEMQRMTASEANLHLGSLAHSADSLSYSGPSPPHKSLTQDNKNEHTRLSPVSENTGQGRLTRANSEMRPMLDSAGVNKGGANEPGSRLSSRLTFSPMSVSSQNVGVSESKIREEILGTGTNQFDAMKIDPYSSSIEDVRKALLTLQREVKRLRSQSIEGKAPSESKPGAS